jgi:pilus assembly protein CpaB
MNKRALFVSFIVALLGAALLVIYLRRFEEEASGGEPVRLLSAVKQIEAGQIITEDMLSVRAVPRAYVEDRAILEAEKPKILGLRMGHMIQAQQTVLWTDLAISMSDRKNLSSLLDPNYRAVTVKAGTEGRSVILVRPGDRIDVIVTMPQAGGNGDARTAVVLLQNVLVLAVGSDTGAEQVQKGPSTSNTDMVLSLRLNLAESQLLALATEKGRITVALRSPDDVRVTEGMTDLSSSALFDTKARVQTGRREPIKLQ